MSAEYIYEKIEQAHEAEDLNEVLYWQSMLDYSYYEEEEELDFN